MSKLLEHSQKKAKKVNAFDIISTGLGIGGGLMVAICFMQPKNSLNAFRLPVAFGLFAASVAAEKMRESELFSLERAEEYQKNIQSERIKRNTVLHETLHELAEVEEFYGQIPMDRWDLAHERTGIKPPILEMRKADPLIDQEVATLPDPTEAGYDPELEADAWEDPQDSPQEEPKERSSFIPAEMVDQWFAQMGDNCPQSLRDEWNQSGNARGIAIDNNQAKVIKNG